MNAPSVDIAAMLEAESSLGLVLGTNLFVGGEPADPVDSVTIFDTQGLSPEFGLDTFNYYNPSIQIRVRDSKYVDGWDLINAIKIALHGRAHETWNGTRYMSIQCMGDPGILDYDQNDRVRFVVNFNIQRRD